MRRRWPLGQDRQRTSCESARDRHTDHETKYKMSKGWVGRVCAQRHPNEAFLLQDPPPRRPHSSPPFTFIPLRRKGQECGSGDLTVRGQAGLHWGGWTSSLNSPYPTSSSYTVMVASLTVFSADVA